MAIEVELPDGTVVEFPDGTPRQVMEGALKDYAAQAPRKLPIQITMGDTPGMDPTEGQSFGQNFMQGAGKSLVDTGRGFRQIGAWVHDQITPTTIKDLIGSSGEYERLVRQHDEDRRIDAPLMNTGGGVMGNVVGQIGQAYVPGAGGAKLLAGAGKAAPYIRAAAGGALYSGVQPVGTGESRTQNALIGAGAGLAGQGIASGASRAAASVRNRMPATVRQSIQDARAAGIPLHASQVTDSRALKTMGSVVNQLPFTGAGAAARKQQAAFNRAVAKTFGAKADSLSDDVMEKAGKQLSDGYDRIFAGRNVALDQKATLDLLRLRKKLDSEIEAGPREVVAKQMERVFDNIDGNGEMPGKVYQSLRSEWGKSFPKGTDKGRLLNEARKILDEAASRSLGPQDAAALKRLNGMWANYRTTQDALKQVSGAAGDVKPASLYPLMRKGGTPEMKMLAKVGQNVLKDPVPDSGTASRSAALAVLGVGSAGVGVAPVAKMALTGALAGRALNSNTLSKLVEQGKPITGLSRLAQGAPAALPVAANTYRTQAIAAAALAQPDAGPEILANLAPEDREAAIADFAKQTGMDPTEVARRVQVEAQRLERLTAP